MVAILMALIVWFPFSIPKDTTHKIVFVNETKEAVIQNKGANSGNIYAIKGKQITECAKVKLIIPNVGKRIAETTHKETRD